MDNDLYFKNDTYMRESHDQSKNCTMNLSIQNSGEINFTQGNKVSQKEFCYSCLILIVISLFIK